MAGEPRWPRWRVRAGYPVALTYHWLARPTPRTLAVGGVIGLAGLLLRALAAGYLRKHESLATAGPYAWTRNPLYLGSAALGLGLLVAGNDWLAAAIVTAYFLAFYPAVTRREEQDLRERYGAAYEDYAREVPLFWPRRPSREIRAAGFSFELYRRNREYRAAVGFAAGLALLLLKMLLPGLNALRPG